jgi:hypothetical protein
LEEQAKRAAAESFFWKFTNLVWDISPEASDEGETAELRFMIETDLSRADLSTAIVENYSLIEV